MIVVLAPLVAAGCALTAADDHTATVNALWYGKQSDGHYEHGLTPVTIHTQLDEKGDGFAIDLSSFSAAGSGPVWDAAASAAAVTATIDSAINPSDVTVQYRLSESIDGPSGGAVMAVGVTAALLDSTVPPNASMTGTIIADGSVGVVGGIPEKIRAAKAAGLASVLIPDGQVWSIDPVSGDTVNNFELARSLGVKLGLVRSLDQAYNALIGPSPSEQATTPGPPSAQTQQVLAQQLQAVSERVAKIDPAAVAIATAKGAGNPQGALTDLIIVERNASAAAGLAKTTATIKRSGLDAASAELRQQADALAQQAQALLTTAEPNSIEQLTAYADSTAGATAVSVQTQLVQQVLNMGMNEAALQELAVVLANDSYRVQYQLPMARELAASITGKPMSDPGTVANFLARYAQFLADGAKANYDYVDRRSEEVKPDDSRVVTSLDLVDRYAAVWQEQSKPSDDLAAAQRLYAIALDYFIASSDLVSSVERSASTIVNESGAQADSVKRSALSNQAVSSLVNTAQQARILAGADLDPTFTTWTSQLGYALTLAARANQPSDSWRYEGLADLLRANLSSKMLTALNSST